MAPRVDSECPAAAAKDASTSGCACAPIGSLLLPTLSPTTLEPACASERGRAVLALSAIDAIRVTRHPTRESFVVDVFTRSAASPASGGEYGRGESHIPTRLRDRQAGIPMHKRFALARGPRETADSAAGARTPAASFEKRLGACVELRDALYNAAVASHARVLQCAFCRELIEYVLWAHKVPAGLGARMLFHRERELDKVAALLSAFLRELLARTLHPPCMERAAAAAAAADALGDAGAATDVPWCRAQSRAPGIVLAFLLQTQLQTQSGEA